MPLSKAQIDHIRSFINSRGFTHVEVEMEILDHVATGVENLLETEPGISLDQAIQKVHRSFGVMGFSTFEDQVKVSLGKRIMRMYSHQLWQQWSTGAIAKMALSALVIFALLILSVNLLEPGLFKITAFSILAVAGSIPAFYHQRIFKKWGKRSLMLGSLLWPFLFSTLGSAYITQVLPVYDLTQDRTIVNAVLVALSLITSTCTWAAIGLTKEVYHYTDQRWLKYVRS